MIYYICTILFLFFSGCNLINKKNKPSDSVICTEQKKLQNLLQLSIDIPGLQQFFEGQKIIKLDELIILKNSCFNDSIKLNKFNKPVRILSKLEIKEHGYKAFLEFKEIKIVGDTANVLIRYEIEGLYVSEKLINSNCKWTLMKVYFEETK
jgi:hypothetical protein